MILTKKVINPNCFLNNMISEEELEKKLSKMSKKKEGFVRNWSLKLLSQVAQKKIKKEQEPNKILAYENIIFGVKQKDEDRVEKGLRFLGWLKK